MTCRVQTILINLPPQALSAGISLGGGAVQGLRACPERQSDEVQWWDVTQKRQSQKEE